MSQRRCPTCKKQFDPDASRTLPFCSQRCREIDLGRWLKEEMAVPVELPTGDEPPRADDADHDAAEDAND